MDQALALTLLHQTADWGGREGEGGGGGGGFRTVLVVVVVVEVKVVGAVEIL